MHNFSRARLLLESRLKEAMGNDRARKGEGKGQGKGKNDGGQQLKPCLQGGGLGVHLSANPIEEKDMNSNWAHTKEGHTWERFTIESRKLTFQIYERQMTELKTKVDADMEKTEEQLLTEFTNEATSTERIKKMPVPLWRRQEQLALAIKLLKNKKRLKKAEKRREEESNDESVTTLKRKVERLEKAETEMKDKRARDAREIGKQMADKATEDLKAKFQEEDLKNRTELIRDHEKLRETFLIEDTKRAEEMSAKNDELAKVKQLLAQQTALNEDLAKALSSSEGKTEGSDGSPTEESANEEPNDKFKLFLTCCSDACEGCWTGSREQKPAGCGICGGAWAIEKKD